MGNHLVRIVILSSFLSLSACSMLKEKPAEPAPLSDALAEEITQEDAQDMLATGAGNWFYGQGVGNTATKVATSIAFPPLIIYYLGNTALNVAGYEGVYVTDALPEQHGKGVSELYDTVTSVPGRVNSAIAGTEYRTPEVIDADGGYWGQNKVIAKSQERTVVAERDAAANGLIVRNDLYGQNRTGS